MSTNIAVVKEKDLMALVITNKSAIKFLVRDVADDAKIRLPTFDEIAGSRQILKKLEGRSVWVAKSAESDPFILDVKLGGKYESGVDARLWPFSEAEIVGFGLGAKNLRRE